MRRNAIIASLLILTLVIAGANGAGGQAPTPSAGEQLVGGLINPRGLKVGPDGMLYVAEAGTGGDTSFTVEGAEFKNGFTGRISKVDPATGTRTTVIDGLPSSLSVDIGDSIGPADVAFVGNTLYYLHSHGGDVWGFPDHETGIYRVQGEDLELIADIGAFNVANPVEDVTAGVQQDIEPGGNPYSMIVRDNAFYVVDGNQNQVMRVALDGTITRLAEIDGHLVSTGIAAQASGPFRVATLGAFPFAPADGRVLSVASPSGTVTEVARGYSALTDVEFSSAGQLYALQFAEQATDPNGPPFTGFSGKVLRVNSDGTMTPIITGLAFGTSMAFSGDTLFVTNHSVDFIAPGEIWMVENFSTVQPPAAQPTTAPPAPGATATPRTGVVAPDTGTGSSASGGNGLLLVAGVIAIAAAGMVAAGALVRDRR